MSLDSILSQAAAEGKLLDSALKNIQALFAGSDSPVYRASVEELAQAGQWSELNDRFFQSLKFGTGGLRGRTIGKIVTKAERGHATPDERPEFVSARSVIEAAEGENARVPIHNRCVPLARAAFVAIRKSRFT